MQTFVFLRHAEKPAMDLGQLSPVGFQRALALPPVLFSKFGKPDRIVACETSLKPDSHGTIFSYVRPVMTIEPFAIMEGMEIDTRLPWDETSMLEIELSGFTGLTIVCWEHHTLHTAVVDLVKKFNGNYQDIPEWDGTDFDSLWIVKIVDGVAQFMRDSEGLNNQK